MRVARSTATLIASLLWFSSESLADKCVEFVHRHNDGVRSLDREKESRLRKANSAPIDSAAAADCEYKTWFSDVYLEHFEKGHKTAAEICPKDLRYWHNNQVLLNLATVRQIVDRARREKAEACERFAAPTMTPRQEQHKAAQLNSKQSSATCSSTITGANLPPAPKEQCDKGKKWLNEARAARKSWFGSKDKAEPIYKQAAQVYREAGDNSRADLALEESQAEDVTVYERAERDAEDRPKNLKEAESQKDIARKIELGAYDSKSCGDLLKAADYYFEAARLYLKASEIQATNALLLRRDQLVSIADEAKSRGACEGKALPTRALPMLQADTATPTKPLTESQCRKLAAYLDQKDIATTVPAAAMRVELVPLCQGIILVFKQQCHAASVHWRKHGVPPQDSARKLAAANCDSAPFR